MLQTLPQSANPWIDVEKLSHIFDDTTNSYKYFFFLSLIDLCRQTPSSIVSAPAPQNSQPSSGNIGAGVNGGNGGIQELAHTGMGLDKNKPCTSNTSNAEPSVEPLAIPLYKVLWHMLELSFSPISEFHVRLPYQDRLPILVREINTYLTSDNTPLTYLKRDSGLQELGQAVFQDLHTPAKQRRLGWPQLKSDLSSQTATSLDSSSLCIQVRRQDSLEQGHSFELVSDKAGVFMPCSGGVLSPNNQGNYKICIEGSSEELEKYEWLLTMAKAVQEQATRQRPNTFFAARAALDSTPQLTYEDILKACLSHGLKVRLINTQEENGQLSCPQQTASMATASIASMSSMATINELSLSNESNSTQPLQSYKDFLADFASLEKYVPFRLLKPWIGSKDNSAKFSQLEEVLDANSSLDASLPYYLGQLPCFKLLPEYQPQEPQALPDPQQMVKVVVINPRWLSYLQQHYEILQSFAYHKLALRLESLNPLMPALLAKLLPQDKRSALKKQHEYFRFYLQQAQIDHSLKPLCDIYTQQQLMAKGDYALDHFLPWSFVHHDLIWNLTPITPELNSAKSNQLPDEKYIALLAQQQQTLLQYYVKTAQEELASKGAKQAVSKSFKEIDPEAGNYLGRFNIFVSDFLQIGQGYSVEDLSHCSSQDFYKLLADQIKPALQIAANQGFSYWKY